jgi:hypothetical protein
MQNTLAITILEENGSSMIIACFAREERRRLNKQISN